MTDKQAPAEGAEQDERLYRVFREEREKTLRDAELASLREQLAQAQAENGRLKRADMSDKEQELREMIAKANDAVVQAAARNRLREHAERGKGITFSKEETRIIAKMLETLENRPMEMIEATYRGPRR